MSQSVSSPGIEAHLGDVSGQVAIGDYNVQIHAEHGAVVNFAPPDTRPAPRLRPSPILLKPRRIAGLLDREAEVREARGAISSSRPVQLRGDVGIGKTALLRQLAYPADSGTTNLPDIVYVWARQQLMQDLTQSLFDAFYETDSPFKPTDSQMRLLLQDRRALILLDDLELGREDIDALMDIAPQCVFVVASVERRLWGEVCDLPLSGLPLEDGLALVERELGRPLSEDERIHAAVLCSANRGNPLLIMQSVARARDERKSLADLIAPVEAATAKPVAPAPALASLPEPAQRLLMTMASIGGLPISAHHLAQVAQVPDPEPHLAALTQRNLIQADNSDYTLAANLIELVGKQWDVTPTRDRALAYFAGLADQSQTSPKLSGKEIGVMLLLQKEAAAQGRWTEVTRLARGVDVSLAVAGKWGAWGEALSAAQQAARESGEKKAEGWALHELGTRALCLGDRPSAKSLLTRALDIRESIGDQAGALATRHNLDLLLAPPLPDGRRRGRNFLKPGLLTLLFLAVVVPIIWLLAGPPSRTPSINLDPADLDFGSQDLLAGGEPRIVTITNKGSAPLLVREISLNGASAGDFNVESEDCSRSPVAPGASCSVALSFTPTSVGKRTAAAQIASNLAGATPAIRLTGRGTSGEITYNPEVVSFGELEIGAGSQARDITLHNGGSSSFTVAGLTVLPATNKPEFNIAAETCSEAPVLPGADCKLTISFTPSEAGRQAAKLRVISATGVTYSVPLSGAGRTPETAGYCCKNGVVGKTSKNECQSSRGFFSENYDEVVQHCQPKPTPSPLLSPTPLEGYCCKDGNISKANSNECKAAGGFFSQNLADVRRRCQPVSTPTPLPTSTPITTQAGYCCRQGKISKATAGECTATGGFFYQSLALARRACQTLPTPTPTPIPTPLSGYCCRNGRVSRATAVECKDTGGFFSQNLAAVRAICQPRPTPTPTPTPLAGYCCSGRDLYKATASECRSKGGVFSQNLAALRRFCQPRPTPTPTPPPPSGYCCRDGRIFKATAPECKNLGGFFSENPVTLRRYCQPSPSPTPSPQSGYCCKDGRVSKSTPQDCDKRGGLYFQNRAEAQRRCSPSGSTAENGWCCMNGQLSGTSRQECQKQHGTFYASRQEAKQACKPPIIR